MTDDHPMYDPDYDGTHERFRKILQRSFIKEERAVMKYDEAKDEGVTNGLKRSV